MKIGITGGAGFIGGHVADIAEERGHQVVIFDRRDNGDHGGRSVFLGDVMDDVAMTELAAHTDGIIHLAACLGTKETIENPRPAALTNVLGGLNFLEAVTQYDMPGVYIGVGNHWMNNTYSISKTTIERFAKMFNQYRGARINQVRAVNAYGPRQSVPEPFGPAKVQKITPMFTCAALTGQDIRIFGDGQQVSDMVHVRDLALALVTALEKADQGIVFDRVVECGPSEHKTVLEVAQLVQGAAQKLGFDPVGYKHEDMRKGENPGDKVTADTTTLELVDLDADMLVPVEDGIRDTVGWFAENWLPTYKAGN